MACVTKIFGNIECRAAIVGSVFAMAGSTYNPYAGIQLPLNETNEYEGR